MDRAWERIQRRLISLGKRPQLILSPWSLWDLHLAEVRMDLDRQALSMVNSTRIADVIEERRGEVERLWGTLNLIYDADEGDDIDAGEERSAAEPVIFIGKPPPYWLGVR